MDITNISVLRKNLFNTVDNVIEFNQPVTVSTKKGNAVIVSEEEYRALQETVLLMCTPGMYKKIKAGEKEKIEDMAVYDPDEEW